MFLARELDHPVGIPLVDVHIQRWVSQQNAALVSFRIPSPGQGFTLTIRSRYNPDRELENTIYYSSSSDCGHSLVHMNGHSLLGLVISLAYIYKVKKAY